jgi:hypothetical protein
VRHDPYYEAHRYGSLKDDVVVTGSTKPIRKAIVKRPVRDYRAAEAIEAKTSVASAEPAAYIKAPPPSPHLREKSATDEPPRKVTIPASAPNPSHEPKPPLTPVDDPAAVAEMLAEGQTLFDQGKVVEARRRFVAAMNGPVPEVLLALARSYDTYHLSRLPTADGAPDMQRALVLYERALERGAKDAAPDLERTRSILKIPR